MSFYIFTRENLALFQQVHNEPDKAVIYGSDQIVLRWPQRQPRYPDGMMLPPVNMPQQPVQPQPVQPQPVQPQPGIQLPIMPGVQLPGGGRLMPDGRVLLPGGGIELPVRPGVPVYDVPQRPMLTESETIYIPDMILPNGKKLPLKGIVSLQEISFYNDVFNNNPYMTQVVIYEAYNAKFLLLYIKNRITLLIFPRGNVESSLNNISFELNNSGIHYIRYTTLIAILDIEDAEKYYIVNEIYTLPDYEKITGKEYKVNFAEMVRKFPKYAERFLHDPTEYEIIFDDLITEADLQDFLIKAGENFIKSQESYMQSEKLQLAYFNTGMILANHPDQAKRDLAIDYLLKAGDMPEAKSLRTRLFLNRVGLNLDIPINLDLETLFKLASLIKK